MVNVLVTGSQGVLGKVLVKELKHRNYNVLGCDLHHAEKDEIRCDVAEARQVENLFNQFRPEVVYHLAAEFGRKNGQEYYEQLWKTNCIGTRNIIEACLEFKSYLVFASSSEVYGSLADRGELGEEILDEYVPSFYNEYALTKFTNEKQIQIAQRNGLKATILRFSNLYGPGELYNDYRSVICLFIYKLLKNLPITVYTETSRAFLYIDDWANTVANVLNKLDECNGITFNIGSENCITMSKLLERILLRLNTNSLITKIEKEDSNTFSKVLSVSRAVTTLEHRETVSLDEGLARTIEWMKKVYG